jgi:hypothetical protein
MVEANLAHIDHSHPFADLHRVILGNVKRLSFVEELVDAVDWRSRRQIMEDDAATAQSLIARATAVWKLRQPDQRVALVRPEFFKLQLGLQARPFHGREVAVDADGWIIIELSVVGELMSATIITQFATVLLDVLQRVPHAEEMVQRVSEEGGCVPVHVLR